MSRCPFSYTVNSHYMSFCENTEKAVQAHNFCINDMSMLYTLQNALCFGLDLKDCSLVRGKKSLLV